MRFDDKERVLWADALCIDQSGTAERNGQVALMADIYKNCKRCLIWLGSAREFDPKNEWSEDLPELLTALSRKHHLDQPGAPQINPMFGFTNIPLMLLNSAEWWERIWVVQEVILAPQSSVIFGSFEMAFSDIANAMEFVNEHDIGSAWNPDGSETDQLCHCMDRMKVTFIWENLLELRNRVYSLLSATQQQPEMGSVPVQSERTEHQYNPDIIDVLLSVRHRDSTDPRDKIFGILSLVQEWGSWEPIKADYSKDSLHVFKEFAAQMIRSEYGSKTLLLARGADLPLSDLADLPTWVPDWSKEGNGYDRYLMAVERQAFRSLSSQSASILRSTLALSCGLSKGKVVELSTAGAPLHKSYGEAPSMENYESFTQTLDSWRTFAGVENVLTLGGVLNRYLPVWEDSQKAARWAESGSYARLMTDLKRSEDTVDFMPQIIRYLAQFWEYQDVLRLMDPDEEAFYRTLIHDTYPLHLRQAQYHTEALCILRLLLIFYNAFADPDRFLTRVNRVVLTKMSETLELVQISRKRLFRTESGRLGIGPQELITGDEIVLFENVKSPFILRAFGKRLVDGKGEQSCYELVGHCYVDGLEKETLDWQTGKEFYLQ